MISIKNYPFFCSWNGGKDSALALYRAIQEGGKPRALLTMLREDGKKSRSYGLPINLIQKQALCLDIPLITCATSWDNYGQILFLCSTISKKRELG